MSDDPRTGRSRLRTAAVWLVYAAVAIACAKYVNDRARLVPKWGEWYMASEGQPYVLLQARAFLSGHLALFPHTTAAVNDAIWGRGGMHTNWGLGVPLLATPLCALARLFGAPGFPDDVFFLLLYAVTAFLLARSLHRVARREDTALVASAAAAGFVMLFPTLVGLVTARFLVYDLTIAVGAVWNILLLAGLLSLVDRRSTWRLVAVCAAAGFVTMIRIPLAVYGATTLVLALVVADRAGARLRELLFGAAAFAAVTGAYLAGNVLRFGAPFVTGYENILSGAFTDRATRWGLPFAKEPLATAFKEMFATFFLLDPVPQQIMMGTPPEAVRPFAVGERWREYYSPTFSRSILALWVVAVVVVTVRLVGRRLWRRDRPLTGEIATLVGAWAIPPSIVLFVFYARVSAFVTRYAADLAPAFAAACLCTGIAVVDLVRTRAPRWTPSAQLAIAAVVALDLAGWRGWAKHLSHPVDEKTITAEIADIDSHRNDVPVAPDHLDCHEPRGRPPVHTHLADWWSDCSFSSGMGFALKHSRCLSFTFAPKGARWTADDERALAGFRVDADFDAMVRCGPAAIEGERRELTLCDPKRPAFLLDGMRHYVVAALAPDLTAIDRLKLLRVQPASVCR